MPLTKKIHLLALATFPTTSAANLPAPMANPSAANGNRFPGKASISSATSPSPRRGLRMPLNDLYQMREEIFQDHVNYQQGYMYFMATDRQVPKDLQERVNSFGLDPDEFPNTGHWPHSIYVREGRRMLSDYQKLSTKLLELGQILAAPS